MTRSLRAPRARGAGLVLLSAAALISAGSISAHAAPSAGHHRTVRNVAPHPNFYGTCIIHGFNSAACVKQELAAIDHARSRQPGHPRPMVLPHNFRKLNVVRRFFVVTNLERVDRGRRPIQGLTSALNHRAQIGAATHLDPYMSGPLLSALGVHTWGSIWAGSLGPLAADYNLMYFDGYDAKEGMNIDCSTRFAAGCWGHRHKILGTYLNQPTLLAGVGNTKTAWHSTAEVITGGTATAPRFTYTWKQALSHGADRRHADH